MNKLLISILILGGCAKAPSSASMDCADMKQSLGTWSEPTGPDTLKLSGFCTGTGSYCAESFSFSHPSPIDGISITIKTLSTNSKQGCLPIGQHVCTVTITGSSMALNCGVGNVVYSKQ